MLCISVACAAYDTTTAAAAAAAASTTTTTTTTTTVLLCISVAIAVSKNGKVCTAAGSECGDAATTFMTCPAAGGQCSCQAGYFAALGVGPCGQYPQRNPLMKTTLLHSFTTSSSETS